MKKKTCCLGNFLGSVIGVVFILCCIIVGWLTPLYAQNSLLESPLVETVNFELLGTDNGILSFTVKGNEMCQYKNGNIELLGGVAIVIMENKVDKEKVKGAIHIQANKLSYNKEQKLCIIEGNVLVEKPQFKVTTEQLSYDLEKEIIFTALPIVIVHKNKILKGDGFSATKDFKQYAINSPTGSIDIEQ